ncbi:gp015 [Rhodococcus phage ReqiPoco6]|uniref:Gp015 n=1 Tax=Rhodococcus phage ReqiPoco6 TaxID=691964 RepID=D4P7N3_9CAUD|nr:gp015 [Rhodococcus phage ReqiPoco6]ADD81013.1 gp015 [Rhodococcus phage ReqiPoco6]
MSDKQTWCIVALPEEESTVWRESSEKVPHMTLLFLGEQDDPKKAEEIATFLQHAVNTSLTKFSMSVKERGVLGEEDADVLFFDQKSLPKQLVEFRNFLLKDATIRSCYDSAFQYPSWTPHLTMGYPKTPAKKTDDHYPVRTVYFDRIALWVMDYDGPTFDLDWEHGDYYSDPEMASGEMAMSGMPAPSNFRHLGVGGKHTPSRDPLQTALVPAAKRAERSAIDIANSGSYIQHYASGKRFDDPSDPVSQRYIRANQHAFLEHLNKVAGGTKFEQENRRYDISTTPDGDWVLSTIDLLTHSGLVETRIRPVTDDRGRIYKYDLVSDGLGQDDVHGAMMHYGIKGMKWGVRRKSGSDGTVGGSSGGTPSKRQLKKQFREEAKAEVAKSKQDSKIAKLKTDALTKEQDRRESFTRPVTPDARVAASGRKRSEKHGTDALSNKELKDLVERMNLEQQYANLQANGKSKTARQAGREYVGDIIKDVGRELAMDALKFAATEGVKYAFNQGRTSASTARDRRRASANAQRLPQLQLEGRRQLGR